MKSAVFMPHGNLTKGGRALLVGLLAASSLVAMSTISGAATASTPHVGSTCVQVAAFPYGSAVAGIAETRGGGGYWIVANDGHIAACGDAPFLGQQTTLNAPIVGIAATPDGGGYYLVGSDGGVFTFGDAEFQGSPSAIQLNTPVIGMAVDPTTGGYWLVATDGGIFAYNAPFLGIHRRDDPQQAGHRHGSGQRRNWVLVGGHRRRGLRLRGSFPRIDGVDPTQQARRRHGLRCRVSWLLARGL